MPPWPAVSQQTQRWLAAGDFDDMVHDLRALLRWTEGRNDDPTAINLDSRTVQSPPESGTRVGYHGPMRRKGSKLHLAVDTLGHLPALRVECLDQHWFASLEEARQIIEAWRVEYNTERPHRALGQQTPAVWIASRPEPPG